MTNGSLLEYTINYVIITITYGLIYSKDVKRLNAFHAKWLRWILKITTKLSEVK